ncbi:hypothetical protein LK994_04460 [Ferruginibacter lapsinanis]|uniref:hypothetical protein n=1 Tax=Ferruginibacter lapsinanis TaxID=563172 RepID=UPI001E6155D4|nr:hypothetical protein [Ferruginibacter lapsinanis]UEG50725.1 hypothetical protein LK994_04460 [Ferruginibacter lapsinanis]
MNTEKQLTETILKTTMMINEKYPELSKYITEMPVTVPDEESPEITIKNLQDYSDSLNNLIKKYSAT